MPDDDLLRQSDEDVLDEQPEHFLAFFGAGGSGAAALGNRGDLRAVEPDELRIPTAAARCPLGTPATRVGSDLVHT